MIRLILPILILGCLALAQSPAAIKVHGHRGARALRPENTLPAFEYAIAAGVDALELDMAVTRDRRSSSSRTIRSSSRRSASARSPRP